MTRRLLTSALAVALLALGACSSSNTPDAGAPQPSASGHADSSAQPAAGGSPTPNPAGSLGDSTPDEAQALLDDATAALAQAPSVNVTARRLLSESFGKREIPTTLRAAWWPQDQTWIGVGTVKVGRRELRTQVLVVDGRTYIRWPTSGRDFTGNWLAVNKSSEGIGVLTEDQTVDWNLDEITSSIVASNASTSGDTTTIIGRIPTGLAIRAFRLTGDELLTSVRDELSDATTLVTVTVVDGFPRELSIFGRDVQLPDQGIPQLSLDVLSPRFFTMRLAPGDQKRAPQRPPPSQVDQPDDLLIDPDS